MRTLGFVLLAAAALLPTTSLAEEFDKVCAYALAEHGAERKTDCSIKWCRCPIFSLRSDS